MHHPARTFAGTLFALVLVTGCHGRHAAPAPHPAGGSGQAPPSPSVGTGTAQAPVFAEEQTEPPPASHRDAAGSSEALADADGALRREARPRTRQGLGTSYGEQRFSSITTVPFERGARTPDVVLSLHYNDVDGLRQLARGTRSFHRASASQPTPDGTFVLRVVDENGRELAGADIAGRRYAVGAPGQRYQIGLENHSGARFEVVASVDGLDVIDGDEAGFDKRGYVLEPFSSVMLEGWRTSEDTVAAFRFSSIEDSYAERRGKGRNVGVIGAAFFHEEGGIAFNELQRRHGADPFPSQFAPPPPPRRH